MNNIMTGKTWPDVIAILIDKLGIPGFLVISFIAGYYYIESDYKKIIDRKDTEIQSLSTNLSKLNEKQLSIAKSAMDINKNFVEATKSSFTEINEVREKWIKSKNENDAVSMQIESQNAEIKDLQEIKSEFAIVKKKNQETDKLVERLHAELNIEKQKNKKFDRAIQQLAVAIVSRNYDEETRSLAKTFLKANKEQSVKTLNDYAMAPDKEISFLNLIGLDKESLTNIIKNDKLYEEWVEIDDQIYGLVSGAKDEFTNILSISFANNKVNDAEVIEFITVISGLIKEGNPRETSKYIIYKEKYGMMSRELDSLKARYSLTELLEMKSSSSEAKIIIKAKSEQRRIEAISFTDFKSKKYEFFNDHPRSLEEIVNLDIATRNKKTFEKTSIAAQLKSLPDPFFGYLKSAAMGEDINIKGISDSENAQIGWALVANHSELLPIQTLKDESGAELITIKILYYQSRYSKEIMTLRYNTETKELKLI